jgi:hypothetical protein
MFRVQRAAGAGAAWQTVCTNASEAYAREVYGRQLRLHSAGRYRLVDPQGKVLAEAGARPLFQRDDSDNDEQRLPTYYSPPPVAPSKG